MEKIELEKHDEHEYDLPSGVELTDGSDLPDYPHWKAGWISGILLMLIMLLFLFFIPVRSEIISRWLVMLFCGLSAFVIGFAIAAFRPRKSE
ncbi:hypothetical protein P0136_01020 [Lentisphaerota bacterium ZTH]|nr:hypothetical protein JYG24_07840 [Lentisphaerota bacterium]WET06594.1 hypothetical protein P0136_01020 [Lentisphaerota bacterium ZTH]